MPQPASAPIEDGVIDVLKNVSRRPIEPTLASDLVADLGFDSLQILEVIAELEDRFDISIPLNDVPATRTVAQVVAQVARLVEDAVARLMASIADAARRAGARRAAPTRATTFVSGDGETPARRTPTCSRRRCGSAGALRAAGLRRGDLVAARAARCGAVPDHALRRVDRRPHSGLGLSAVDDERSAALSRAHRRASCAPPARAPSSRRRALAPAFEAARAALPRAGAGAVRTTTCDGAGRASPTGCPSLDDIAFVQFTSGSTSAPKGVALTHANVSANIDAFTARSAVAASADGRRRELAAAQSRHGAGRHGARRAVRRGARACCCRRRRSCKRSGRVAAAISRHRGDRQLRAQLRLRPVRPAREGPRSRGARPVVLARRRLRRRADPSADAGGLRRASSRRSASATRASCRATAWPNTCWPRRFRRAAGARGSRSSRPTI